MFKTNKKDQGSVLVRGLLIALFSLFVSTLFMKPAFAIGGLNTGKVVSFATAVSTALRAISVSVVTATLSWTGYEILFKKKTIKDCGNIILGCLIIAGSSELAIFMLA